MIFLKSCWSYCTSGRNVYSGGCKSFVPVIVLYPPLFSISYYSTFFFLSSIFNFYASKCNSRLLLHMFPYCRVSFICIISTTISSTRMLPSFSFFICFNQETWEFSLLIATFTLNFTSSSRFPRCVSQNFQKTSHLFFYLLYLQYLHKIGSNSFIIFRPWNQYILMNDNK